MNEFINSLSTLEQVYWATALIGTFIFLIILVLTFVGGDMDSDMEADASDFESDDGGVGFQFFTFKNLVAFLTIFGWAGIACINAGLSISLTIFISTGAGLIMMVLTSLLFYWMSKLTASGTLKIKNALGKVAIRKMEKHLRQTLSRECISQFRHCKKCLTWLVCSCQIT